MFYIFYCYDREGLFFLVGYIINRRNGENVALITLEDFRSLVETVYLLRTPANAIHLLEAIKEQEQTFHPTPCKGAAT